MTAYLDLAGFKLRTIMPSSDVDSFDSGANIAPGFLAQRLTDWSRYIDTRLRKRYAVPFATPTPLILCEWLTALVTKDAYAKRGFALDSAQDKAVIVDPADRALAEIKEAADSNEGLFDLPLKENGVDASGVTKGGPFGYSEQSPYRWTDKQAKAGRSDDGLG